MNLSILRVVIAILFACGVLWALGGAVASANPLVNLSVDENCGSDTHVVKIFTTDVQSQRFITLIGQVFVNGAFTDVGTSVTVQIPIGATTTQTTVVFPKGSLHYRVRVVDSNLDNSAGKFSNDVTCQAPTATPTSTTTVTPTSTPTPTSSATPTSTTTSTATPTSSPSSTATATATNTPVPPSGGGGGGGGGGSHHSSAPSPAENPVVPAVSNVVAPVAAVQAVETPPPPPSPTPTIETAGVQSFAPLPALPTAAPPPPPPPCLAAASVVPVLNPDTGEQAVDQTTGLPMWLTLGDDTGAITLGMACSAAPEIPLGLPATGDGSAATQVDGENVLEP